MISSTAFVADPIARDKTGPTRHRRRRNRLEEIGTLLEGYRDYLTSLADHQLDRKLGPRMGASDLVQETMLGAYRDFHQFRGQTDQELKCWLRQILINRLHRFIETHLALKRDLRREQPLDSVGSSAGVAGRNEALIAGTPSPSAHLANKEAWLQLSAELARLSSEYREVIVLRNFQRLPFAEVAEKMNRSPGATRMLWLRAIRKLNNNTE